MKVLPSTLVSNLNCKERNSPILFILSNRKNVLYHLKRRPGIRQLYVAVNWLVNSVAEQVFYLSYFPFSLCWYYNFPHDLTRTSSISKCHTQTRQCIKEEKTPSCISLLQMEKIVPRKPQKTCSSLQLAGTKLHVPF